MHPPLTPQTRKMISDEAFAKMKRTALLINCSRGPIIDTDALVRALDAKKIAGCALDTTDPEPLPESAPAARPGQRDHQSARRLVQRAGDGRIAGRRAR